MTARSRLVSSCVLATCLALVSCSGDSGPKPADAGVPDASNQPVVGGKLGAAIASAAAAGTGSAKAKSADPNEPPESGIFAEGEADKRQPRGGPPKVDVLSDGVEPRVQLANKLDAAETKTSVTVGMRMGQGVRLPTVTFELSIKPEKAKGDKAAEEKDAAGPAHVAATVTGVSVSPSQPVPKEMGDAIAKLKGTVLRWDQTAEGVVTAQATELPKDAGEGLELIVDSLADTVGTMIAPVPSKPVGKDAYWIVGDRAKTAVGVDVVRFRVFKVMGIENGQVTLSVDVRQYAADKTLKLDGGGGQKQEMVMELFDSQGKGTLVWKAESFVPVRGDVKVGLGARLAGGPPGGRGGPVVQTELTGAIAPPASATPDKKP
ncbi:MAG: hypothetical protein R3F14_09190 [Polyangiaceae bacterium]